MLRSVTVINNIKGTYKLMRVNIKNTDGINFEATTSKGVKFDIKPKEVSPIELFALATITCSGTDMVMMPQKQGHTVTNLDISGDVERAESYPQKFTTLHVTYSFDSDAEDDKAKKWVMASMETYCSTLNTIRSDVRLSYSIIHNGKTIADKKEIISGAGMAAIGGEDMGDIGGACCS